ncbi:MAG TPA: hypothetical protein H9756_02000 [Candidatus Mediterraneibacter gallistercoris]|uniref:Uncharacterized protein n=1 Tax=Candidatus Mediterraneibacter gallistercoris TaxID=2838671 RepID=A0A9D2P348_9FIRM|nr:hypothetical protein [Candidatus Mediterraneibacter gallistercoris]
MEEKDNVTEQLKELISVYDFNKNTLSRYLDLPLDQVECIAEGNIDFLPDEPLYRFHLFNKIAFLYLCATEDKDLKSSGFLEVLISYHGLSKTTIAKMAGVKIEDVERVLINSSNEVPEDAKYRIAVTSMALRFFLKDCEQEL